MTLRRIQETPPAEFIEGAWFEELLELVLLELIASLKALQVLQVQHGSIDDRAPELLAGVDVAVLSDVLGDLWLGEVVLEQGCHGVTAPPVSATIGGMAQDTPRYTVPCEGTPVERATKGLQQAFACALDLGADITLLVHGLDQVTGSCGTALGRDNAKALRKSRQIGIADGRVLKLRTVRNFNEYESPTDIVLGMWANSSMIDLMEDQGANAAALIVVPGLPEDSKTWELALRPVIVGEDKVAGEENIIDDPLLLKGLESIEGAVDPRYRMHASEKKAAVGMLRHLRKAGCDFPERSLQAWALRSGWAPKAAQHLEDLGQAVRAGKRIQFRGAGPGSWWKPNIIEILRAQIEEETFEVDDDGVVH